MLKQDLKIGDIIEYPVPGIIFGKWNINTIPSKAKILKIYDIECDDGIIINMELIESKINLSGKLKWTK